MSSEKGIKIPPEVYLSLPETGMGYVIASVTLKDGTRYDQVAIDSGFITKIRGIDNFDFTYEDIDSIEATHEKWNFCEK